MNTTNKPSSNKKIITICSLSALCAAILAGVYFLTRDPENEFVPAAYEPSESHEDTESEDNTSTWEEKADADMDTERARRSFQESNQREGSATDDTQTIISEDDSGSTANLADTKTREDAVTEKPQDKPLTTSDTTDPDRQPEYDSSVPQQSEASPVPREDSGNNAPDTSNSHTGQVYDPVFGWVTVGKTQQDTIDSDGDINKQVGTMGGN